MRSGKQPLDELVSNLQVSFLFHDAAGYIGITGKASADILLADVEAGYFSLVFQLFSDTGFQRIAGNRAITENVFCGFSAIQRDS